MKIPNKIIQLITAFICLITLGCSTQPNDSGKLATKIGHENFQALKNSKTAYLILSKGMAVDQKKIELTPALKETLIRILTADESYHLERTKKCLFISEYTLEFKDQTSLLVLISPSCKQIKILQPSDNITLDIDPAFDELMTIINHSRQG